LPPVSTQKRDALLRYAIEDKLTIDPATVHAVVLGTSASAKSNEHVIAAIDRAWLTNVLTWLKIAGIEPVQAISDAAMIPVTAGEWGVVLEGAHGLARRPDGFAYSFDVERPTGQSSGVPMEPPFALALALKEARDHRVSPSQLTVFVDRPADAAWIDNWQQRLDCRVRAALRGAAQMVTPAAGNLLSGDFAPRAASRGWIVALKPVLAVAVAIVLLQLTFTVVDAWRLDQRRRALENEMSQVFKDAFPKAQAIVDPPLQMQRNLEAAKRDAGLSSGDDPRVSLAQLTAILKSVPGLVPRSIGIRDGTVAVDVSVPDPVQQATLRTRAAETHGATVAVDAQNVMHLTMKAQR
jgi:general secretion pathway protein L